MVSYKEAVLPVGTVMSEQACYVRAGFSLIVEFYWKGSRRKSGRKDDAFSASKLILLMGEAGSSTGELLGPRWGLRYLHIYVQKNMDHHAAVSIPHLLLCSRKYMSWVPQWSPGTISTQPGNCTHCVWGTWLRRDKIPANSQLEKEYFPFFFLLWSKSTAVSQLRILALGWGTQVPLCGTRGRCRHALPQGEETDKAHRGALNGPQGGVHRGWDTACISSWNPRRDSRGGQRAHAGGPGHHGFQSGSATYTYVPLTQVSLCVQFLKFLILKNEANATTMLGAVEGG